MIPLEVTIDRPGASALRLTPSQESLHWSTAAVGGFGGASFTLAGDVGHWKREIPKGSLVRIVFETFTLWEGQVEDVTLVLGGDELGARVQCFGLRRKLEEVSVRRIWSKRNLDFQKRPGLPADPAIDTVEGQIDPADLTLVGLKFVGTGANSSTAHDSGRIYITAGGLTLNRVMGTYAKVGSNTNFLAQIWSSSDGGQSYTNHLSDGSDGVGSIDLALVANANVVLWRGYTTATGIAINVDDQLSFYDIRVLGTSLREDAAGGFYGGTILRDLIALVPGLSIGIIDTGSDFTIQAIERVVRQASLSVVEEVAGYYSREWVVWEEGRFDWKNVNRDEVQWMARVADLQAGSEITSSVDGVAKTVYVLYADAASQRDAETSATSTDPRNPYVKQGKTKDALLSVGFPMTSLTSSQLASRIKDDIGGYTPVHGRLVLSATTPVKRANGPSLSAFQIRGGENILVSDLPKTELFTTGRDGETLFHIVSTDADLQSGFVTLEIEGQTRRADVLLARLAAATRVFTG